MMQMKIVDGKLMLSSDVTAGLSRLEGLGHEY